MGIKRIDKKSYLYLFLKQFVGFWHNRVFYKRVVIQNRSRVPKDAHLIFTGNHQNALMDALVFLFGVKNRLVFMARSDIFKNQFVAALLYFFRLLPIFRIRDGYDSVKKNDQIFKKTIDVIKNKIGIVIMAEGNHGGQRRLRPLKKGFARIAFQTEEANNFDFNMQIVPVGIDYSSYENFRSELLINFGEPIPISDYSALYKESPAIAINQIKEKLSESLKPLMVHIESEKYYALYNELRELYKEEMAENLGFPSCKQPYKLQGDQTLIKHLSDFEKSYPEKMDLFQKMVLDYRNTIQKYKLNYSVAKQKTASLISLLLKSVFYLLVLPVFLSGWLLNYWPFGLSNFAAKKLNDLQFHSSFKFVISLILWPLGHFLLSLLVWFIFKNGYLLLGFFIAMPVLGIAARAYWVGFTQFLIAFRWYIIKKRKPLVYRKIKQEQQAIFDQMNVVIV